MYVTFKWSKYQVQETVTKLLHILILEYDQSNAPLNIYLKKLGCTSFFQPIYVLNTKN